MLIGKVSDDEESKRNGQGDDGHNIYHEYDTANQLYDIMTETHQFHANDETITAGDLVILYKNLDIGTKLMTEAKYSQTKPSNQYVETIIYNDEPDSDDSEIGEIYSTEDIRNIMMINKERIDLLSKTSSFETNLCQKYGNVAMNPSNLAASYNKHFLFKDPFIKDQLNSFTREINETNVLPTSLLDYICCKRLEDNYNFYMDSVITYVKHTIEHLKRISNGDYLTDKAKKKWREVADPIYKKQDVIKTVLANSLSIPLQEVPKVDGIKRTWNVAVHSEVDVRSLTKILEKKIVLEIPNLICGTYKLFSKRYYDNLIISCKKETNALDHETRSRVDVVLKLKKSNSGNVMSKLNSIMILQTSPQTSIPDLIKSEPIPLLYEKEEEKLGETPKIVELNEDDEITRENTYESSILTNKSQETYEDSIIGTNTDISSISPRCRKHDFADTFMLYHNVVDHKIYSDEQTEANFCITSPNNLRYSVQRLNMNSPVPEESEVSVKKKKSPSKVRVKSPYENSSHVIEEKKRKRLLEIRERRENNKKSLSENCKISKHKYTKGAIMAQASSSVTKLSITNKSFYNSIYGQAINSEGKHSKRGRKLQNGDLKIVVEMESCEEELQRKSPRLEKNKEKYINHSYYLDEADTEVMRLQMKQMSETENATEACTASSSIASDDFSSNLSLLKNLISPPISVNNPTENTFTSPDFQENIEISESEVLDGDVKRQLKPIQSASNSVPTNTPKDMNLDVNKDLQKDCKLSIECRKSIDKLYNLMKVAGKTETSKLNSGKKNYSTTRISDAENKFEEKDLSSIQPSDSGTSVKHNLASSIPSCFSFEKPNDQKIKKTATKKSEIPITVSPKVLINTKSQGARLREDKLKRERKKVASPVNKISENPLKAISQLLHEFDNVQKNRFKNGNESKSSKRFDSERKNSRQVTFKKPLHQEQHLKESEPTSRVSTPKDRKSRQSTIHTSKAPYTKPSIDEKPVEKFNRRRVIDILNEVKEARGEAVRGPPKSLSRLDSLAQPKKSYIQAQNEQYQNRNIKNVMNRQQRFMNNSPAIDRRDALNIRHKRGSEMAGSQKLHSAVPPLGSRRSSSSSPEGNHKRSLVSAIGPLHTPNVPEAPETLMKKMVAVESYVNNHYGRSSLIRDLKDFIGAQKSRVPIIPTDLDIGSVTSSRTADESTTLGKKLHNMIDTMINTTLPVLTSLHEKEETSLCKDNVNEAFIENIEQIDELISNTEFPIDIFGDKSITTAVASLPKDNELDEPIISSNIDFIAYDIQPFNSTTELERLENALYRRLSGATFQKRLRIKNLTLTPKHSLQQVFVLHQGDAGSLVVQSTLSQNITKTKSKTTSELYKPTHSKSHIDWTFANIPKQITTVGYAIPCSEYTKEETTSQKRILNKKSNPNGNESNENPCVTSDIKFKKSNQCFKGSPAIAHQGVQANPIVGITCPFQLELLKSTDEPNACKINLDDNKLQKSTRNTNKSAKKSKSNKKFEESKLSLVSNEHFPNLKNDVNNTTSLDILVGLLNEIKNITTCQTYITKHEASVEDSECKQLKFILKNAKLHDNSFDHSPENALSFDSLGNVEQQSNLCVLLPSNNSSHLEPFLNSIPKRLDKEVNVSISGIECVHTFTEVPSRFLPITVHQSTNVTSSLIGVISEPSVQSLNSFSDYQTLYCNSSYNRIVELANIEPKPSVHTFIPVVEETEKIVDNKILLKNQSKVIVCEMNEGKRIRKKEIKNKLSDFDPLLKIKRDVLVTVYSILVMTVFAALSFPEILYRS